MIYFAKKSLIFLLTRFDLIRRNVFGKDPYMNDGCMSQLR